MNIKLIRICTVIFFLGIIHCSARTILIDFFHEPGCQSCENIRSQIFPEIKKQFPEMIEIIEYDIGIETNFLYLLQLEDALNYTASERAYFIINRQYIFGASPSQEEVFAVLSELMEGETQESLYAEISSDLVQARFNRFTLLTVMAGGLIDGINPCAISTLVFFMSLLAVAKVQNRLLLWLGISFCIASFLTYLAIGFGLFRVLHLFSGFYMIRLIIERGMICILLLLSFFSFRDTFYYRKTGCASDVTLQLSARIKRLIHVVMHRGIQSKSVFLGGLFIGCVVTVLESVCTGQVYVPVLVIILKDADFSSARAWGYLLVYNLMFIMPLLFVFTAVYSGLRMQSLQQWSRRNVVFSKILTGLFFILMTGLIVRL